MNVVILDDYQDAVRRLDCFSRLASQRVTVYSDPPADLEELATRVADADALVLIRERTAITDELLRKLPHLKLISQTGKIGSHIDLKSCTSRGVAVAEGTGSPVAPAELCWALIMAASRNLPQYCEQLRAGEWQSARTLGIGRTLKGKTLGIWGYGKIGRIVAGYGRAFGMEVLVWSRARSLATAFADGFRAAESRSQLLAESDVLSIHLRLTEETRGSVSYGDLVQMKSDALFVNMSRAELVAHGALETVLNAGRPGFAAVDVYEEEPVRGGDHPLLRMDNVVCTPHIGFVERDSYELYFGTAFDNILAFAAGTPLNIANPEVLSRGPSPV